MKINILLLTFGVFLTACSGSETKTLNTDSASTADQSTATRQYEVDTAINDIGTEDTGGASSSSKGAQLIAGSDCMSCHKDNEKLIGPSYKAISEKYPNTDGNADMLADKIVKGGAGNWGEIPMTPHPALSKNDAHEMAKYILSLR